jgi:hypothetical protein
MASVVSKDNVLGSHLHLNCSNGTSSKTLSAMVSPYDLEKQFFDFQISVFDFLTELEKSQRGISKVKSYEL